MRIPVALVALVPLAVAVAVACSGSAPKPEGPIVKEGSSVPETCCCKSNPLTSEDGRPMFENANRMECSSKHGECVDEVQCQSAPQPE